MLPHLPLLAVAGYQFLRREGQLARDRNSPCSAKREAITDTSLARLE